MAKRGGLGRGLDALIPDRKPEKSSGKKKGTAQSTKKKRSTLEELNEEIAQAMREEDSDSDSANGETGQPREVPEAKKTEGGNGAAKKTTKPGRMSAGKAAGSKTTQAAKTGSRKEAAEGAAAKKKPGASATKQVQTEAAGEPEVKENDPQEGAQEKTRESVVNMRISLVEPNRDQPRKYFDDQAIEELADSVRQFGIIQPLLVQKKDDYYEIIAGERRWRAAQKVGLKEVPVIVKNFTSQEAVEVSLIENIQREDLNPIEEAKAYDRLVREYGLSQEDVAGRVSKSRSAVTNSMRLLKLEESVQKLVETGAISEGHARAILGLSIPEEQRQTAEAVMKEHLSVRQTEKLVRDKLNPKKTGRTKRSNPVDEAILQDLSEQLKTVLGTKVSISPSGRKGGKIEIEYYSDDDLDRLFTMLRSAH